MPTPELNLVKPTEYEKLMSQIELESKEFKPVFQATLKAVTDIILAYGHIQRELFVPGLTMTLEKFLVLNKKDVSFIRSRSSSDWNEYETRGCFRILEGCIKSLVAFSWDWKKQEIDTFTFVECFHKNFRGIWDVAPVWNGTTGYHIFLGCDTTYLSQLIPPNFKELLQQVLEHRKQNTSTKKEVKE